MKLVARIAAIRGQTSAQRLGMCGATAAILFLAVLIALHALRADISSIRNYVSEYAVGPYGILFQAASFIHGIGNVALAIGLWLVVAESRLGRRGAALFGVAAVSVGVAALVPTDPSGTPPTPSGNVHLIAGFASFAAEGVALFFLAHAFRRPSSWSSFASTTLFLATLGSASFLLLLVFRLAGIPPGLAERAALLAFVMWELLAGLRLAR